jgi:hypothetical protein
MMVCVAALRAAGVWCTNYHLVEGGLLASGQPMA